MGQDYFMRVKWGTTRMSTVFKWLVLQDVLIGVDIVMYALVSSNDQLCCARYWTDYYSLMDASHHFGFHTWRV